MEARRHSIFILITLMLVVTLGTAGIALPYPVLAPFFLGADSNQLNTFFNVQPAILLGLALAVFPLGALLGSPFVGVLADRFGNKTIMVHSLWLSVLGYLFTAIAIIIESYCLFILARFATGLCQGNITIARAISAELHPVIERARSQSLIYAAGYTGWLLGPAIGGYLMVFGTAQVFFVAAVMVLLCLTICLIFLPRNKQTEMNNFTIWQELQQNNSISLLKVKALQPIALFYFLYALGLNGFYEYYPAWMVEYRGFDSTAIANHTVVVTLTMVLCSAFVYPRIHKLVGSHNTLLVGGMATGLTILLLPIFGLQSLIITFVLIGLCISISNGSVPTYLSENFSSLGLGKVMGVQTLLFYGANSLVACIGGFIAVFNVAYVLAGSGVIIVAAAMSYQAIGVRLVKSGSASSPSSN